MISPNNWMCSSKDNNKKLDGLTPGEKINFHGEYIYIY